MRHRLPEVLKHAAHVASEMQIAFDEARVIVREQQCLLTELGASAVQLVRRLKVMEDFSAEQAEIMKELMER